MSGLTRMEAAFLDAVRRLTTPEGLAPSFAELANDLGLAGASGVHRIVANLKAKGRVACDGHRSIRIIGEGPSRASLSELADGDLRRVLRDCKNILGERGAPQ
jgi:SOS-response transcriptional repressor LexA